MCLDEESSPRSSRGLVRVHLSMSIGMKRRKRSKGAFRLDHEPALGADPPIISRIGLKPSAIMWAVDRSTISTLISSSILTPVSSNSRERSVLYLNAREFFMLDQQQLKEWARKLNLSQQAERVIEQIRSSAPARRVQSRRGNVSGRYPSRKMGVTIQFESHRNELAAIYELEHDPTVIELYDQPPAIKLNWETGAGRQVGIWHTADFFVIRTDSAGYEECKEEKELLHL